MPAPPVKTAGNDARPVFALPEGALLLAPMVEISHRPLRELIASFGGCDRYYTEMSSAAAYVSGSPYDRWFLDPYPFPEATVLQFYSLNEARMTEAASRVAAERGRDGVPLGGIDVNFGCSAPHIERSGGGVSWMKDPKAARSLIAAVRKAIPGIPLSVKMRVGYEDSYDAMLDFARGLESSGADCLVLHPRLKNEKFRRLGRWDYVGRLARDLSIPVVGNGDVRSCADRDRAMAAFAPAGIMIGREAIRRPWIFALMRGRERDPGFRMDIDVEACGLRLLALIREFLPANLRLSRARRFFYYYCDNLAFGHHVRWKIQNAPDTEAIEALFRDYFAEVPSDRVRTQAEPPAP